MTGLSRATLFVFACILLSPHVVAQVPTTQSLPRPGMPARDQEALFARIRGRVVAQDTGAALRKAQVRIVPQDPRNAKIATTDPNGNYEIRDLPAGRYTLSVSKARYVTLSYGQRRPFERGKPLELKESEVLDKIDFALPPGAVVTGQIMDEFGEAVSDASVQAMRYSFAGGQRRLLPAGRSGMTNDLGQFRIFGLPPGEYFVSATLRSMVMQVDGDTGVGYAPTYYPGVASAGGAQRVSVASGQELAGLTFALLPTRTARVSGTLTDSAGKPIASAMIMVMQMTDAMIGTSTAAQVKPDGSFSIGSLAPGQYMLSFRPIGPGTGDEEVANVPLTVGGDDIANLRIVTSRGATLAGNVLFAPGTTGALVPSTLQVSATSAEPGIVFGGAGSNRVGDDWTVTLKGLAGRRFIRVGGLPPQWWLQAVRLNGADVTDQPIEFRSNQSMTGLEIVLSNRPTRITGIVTDERGRAAIDYAAIIFADDKNRWGYATRYITMARPDQSGAFLIEKLPPGEYRAIAVDTVEEGEWMDPELLARLQPSATRFILGEGESKPLTLKVTPIR